MDAATRARIQAHAARLAAEAPELKAETKDRLAVLLSGARPAAKKTTRELRAAA